MALFGGSFEFVFIYQKLEGNEKGEESCWGGSLIKNSTKFAELEIPVQKTVGDLEISYKTAQITVQNPL